MSLMTPPMIAFTLLNRHEFTVEVNGTLSLSMHKPILDTLRACPGIRYDPVVGTWVCPIEAHDNLPYALTVSGAVVAPLPRAVLAAITVSSRHRGEGGIGADAKALSEIRAKMPARLFKTLATFQREGVIFAMKNEGKAFIADEMGLGEQYHLTAA